MAATGETPGLAETLPAAVTRFAREMALRSGTPRGELAVLARLEAGPATPGDLAAAQGVRPPTLSKVLRRLEKRQLITLARDEADRRSLLVTLADPGRAELRAARESSWLRGRLAGLSDQDLNTLAAAVPILARLSCPPSPGPPPAE